MADSAEVSSAPEKAAEPASGAPLGTPGSTGKKQKPPKEGKEKPAKEKPAKEKTPNDGGKAGGSTRGLNLEPLEALRQFLQERGVTLEEGWTVEVHKRKPGIATEKMSDIYYFSPPPARTKYRSKPEVLKALTGQVEPKGERKERAAGKSTGPKTRADLHADAKKHLLRCVQLPEVDRMRVKSLGVLAGNFHDAERLFPVGYCTEWHHAAFNCVFISKILGGGDEPLFRVEARPLERNPAPLPKLMAEAKASMDAAAALHCTIRQAGAPAPAAAAAAGPADGAAATPAAAEGSTTPGAAAAAATPETGASPAAAAAGPPAPGGIQWSSKAQEVKRTIAIGYSPDEAWDEMYRTFPTLAFTGEHFGLQLPEVAHLLEGLGGAEQCEKYEFVPNWVLETRKRKADARLHEYADDKSGWTFQRIKELDDRRRRVKEFTPEEAEKYAAEVAEYEAHRKATRERQKELQKAAMGQAKDAQKEAKERAREQAQAQKDARAKIHRYPVEDLEVPLRETEDAMIRGEAPPIHPPRPDPTPIGPETGDVLSIADFFEDEFVSEKDMSTFTPFLLRLAVESPNASALLGDLYCALLKAALVGPDDVEEKYNDTDSPPPPVWLKYLRRDGHSVWPELLRRWVVNGPCAAHYSKAELEMVTKLSNEGPGEISGQDHLTLLRHLCDDVLLTNHARKVINSNEEAREKLNKELREKEKRLKETEKAHTAAKQKEKELKEELERAREALNNPADDDEVAANGEGGEGATPPQPARRMTAAEAQYAIKMAEDKLKEQKGLIKELEKECRFTPSDTMWEDEREEVAAGIDKKLREVIVRASPIGFDRDSIRYWWFPSDPGVLYTERPPAPGPEVDMPPPAARGRGAGAGGDGAQPMETDGAGATPLGATPVGATPAGVTPAQQAGATPVGGEPATEAMEVDGGQPAAAKAADDEEEFTWGFASMLVDREPSTATSEWGRYSTPEELDQLMGALYYNGIRERKLLSTLKRLKEKIVMGMQKRDDMEEKVRKNSAPRPAWFEQGYGTMSPGAIRVAASEALLIAEKVQAHAPQVPQPQGFAEWVRKLRDYVAGRGVAESPGDVIGDVVAGLLSFEEALCMALDGRALKPPASLAEGRAAAAAGGEGAEEAAAAGPAPPEDDQKDDADGQGDGDGVNGPEDLFKQGLEDEAFSEWHEAYEERYRGSNLVIEARAVPHSSKSMQIWRGAFAYLIRRNWREALTRAAQNKSAAQLAYCVVSFSERMVPSLAAMERQSKKASKQRAEEGRPSGRPSRAKRPRVETGGNNAQSSDSDSE